MAKVRSARGQVVDFDLLKIKGQLAANAEVNVKAKSNFLDSRLSKKLTKNKPVTEPLKKQPVKETSVVIENETINIIGDKKIEIISNEPLTVPVAKIEPPK